MDPDLRGTLKELLELTRENNKLLHKVNNRARWAMFGRLLYWLVILGFTVGAFYYLQPYLNAILTNYQKSMDLLQQVQAAGSKLPDFSSWKSIGDSFGTSTASSTLSQSFFDYIAKMLHFK